MTDEVHGRRWEHNEGLFENSYTSSRKPSILLYAEEFELLEEALKREKQLKGWSRKKKEALMKDEHSELHKLSKCMNKTHYNNKI